MNVKIIKDEIQIFETSFSESSELDLFLKIISSLKKEKLQEKNCASCNFNNEGICTIKIVDIQDNWSCKNYNAVTLKKS